MAFSIQSFIKNNCNEQYDVKTFDKLAETASIESNGRYTIKNTHKFLCRYAYVKDGNILLDYNKSFPLIFSCSFQQLSPKNDKIIPKHLQKENSHFCRIFL